MTRRFNYLTNDSLVRKRFAKLTSHRICLIPFPKLRHMYQIFKTLCWKMFQRTKVGGDMTLRSAEIKKKYIWILLTQFPRVVVRVCSSFPIFMKKWQVFLFLLTRIKWNRRRIYFRMEEDLCFRLLFNHFHNKALATTFFICSLYARIFAVLKHFGLPKQEGLVCWF